MQELEMYVVNEIPDDGFRNILFGIDFGMSRRWYFYEDNCSYRLSVLLSRRVEVSFFDEVKSQYASIPAALAFVELANFLSSPQQNVIICLIAKYSQVKP